MQARTPLKSGSVDVVIMCLALMGTTVAGRLDNEPETKDLTSTSTSTKSRAFIDTFHIWVLFSDFLLEARRIMVANGVLKIVVVRSRLESDDKVHVTMRCAWHLCLSNVNRSLFILVHCVVCT